MQAEHQGHSAVLILSDGGHSGGAVSGGAGRGMDEQLLFTQRARHLNLHAGEVAFPGGRWEPGDADLCATALRESEEEVGLDPAGVRVLGQLGLSRTRGGMKVTPFFGTLTRHQSLLANPAELAALFWVPLAYLRDDPRIQTDVFTVMGKAYWAPVYEWQGFRIWGFTARVLVEFMNTACDTAIEREHEAPERHFEAR